MVINLIVVAVTLLMGGFVGVWLACPRCRLWIEAPKWQPLAWDEPAPRSGGQRRRALPHEIEGHAGSSWR
jgi:hypothetical protein